MAPDVLREVLLLAGLAFFWLALGMRIGQLRERRRIWRAWLKAKKALGWGDRLECEK
jgi:hypothetical protein